MAMNQYLRQMIAALAGVLLMGAMPSAASAQTRDETFVSSLGFFAEPGRSGVIAPYNIKLRIEERSNGDLSVQWRGCNYVGFEIPFDSLVLDADGDAALRHLGAFIDGILGVPRPGERRNRQLYRALLKVEDGAPIKCRSNDQFALSIFPINELQMDMPASIKRQLRQTNHFGVAVAQLAFSERNGRPYNTDSYFELHFIRNPILDDRSRRLLTEFGIAAAQAYVKARF